jgi:hypothetical protein
VEYALFILYVADQQRSRDFYARLLDREPKLDVPGMTEFELAPGAILGLMPSAGIRRLLGTAITDPQLAADVPRCELYLPAADPAAWLARLVSLGGRELSPAALRNWGEVVAYGADPDGHVLAFGAAPDSPGDPAAAA